MCLLALQFRTFAAAPVLVAANREEYYNRPASLPAVQPGSPRVLCGIDQRAGGTWLGVNEHGLVVGVTNRLKSHLPAAPRSRGLLCRELLACPSAAEAIALGERELATDHYAGANYLCADRDCAAVIHAGDRLETIELSPGLHLLSNGDVDDCADARQLYARYLFSIRFPSSPQAFLDRAQEVCQQGPNSAGDCTIILRGDDRGTVSSTLISLAAHAEDSVFLHSPQAPDLSAYADYSPRLRELLQPRD